MGLPTGANSSRTNRSNPSVRFSNATHTTHRTHTTHDTHSTAIVCSIPRDRPSRGIPNLRQAKPGPVLPSGFIGAASSENSSQVGIDKFFNLNMHTLSVEVPSRRPQNRPDVRQADARVEGCRARREGRPGPLISLADHHRRLWLPGFQPRPAAGVQVTMDRSEGETHGTPGRMRLMSPV